MKHALIILYLLLMMAVPGTQAVPAFHYDHVALVRVVDGDTVRLDAEIASGLLARNVSCRLLRISAPEMNMAEGTAAKAALAAFLAGKVLRVDYDKPDSFGRWLVELWADGQNASDWLVANGYAKYQSY